MSLIFTSHFVNFPLLILVILLVATIAVTEWRTKYRREMNVKENITKAVAVDSLLNFETVSTSKKCWFVNKNVYNFNYLLVNTRYDDP